MAKRADDEQTPLLHALRDEIWDQAVQQSDDAIHDFSIEEQKLADTTVRDRLPYNNYTTIDHLQDLVILATTKSSCVH